MIYNPHGDDLVTPAFYLGQCGQQGQLLPPLCKCCKEKKTATRQELRVGKEEKPGRAGSPKAFWACGGACSHRQTVLTLSRGLGEVGEGGCIRVAAVSSPNCMDGHLWHPRCALSLRGRGINSSFLRWGLFMLSQLLAFCLAPSPGMLSAEWGDFTPPIWSCGSCRRPWTDCLKGKPLSLTFALLWASPCLWLWLQNSSWVCSCPVFYKCAFHFLLFNFLKIFIYLAAAGFSCGKPDLSPWPGIEPWFPALEAQSLSHWTAREVPHFLLFFFF